LKEIFWFLWTSSIPQFENLLETGLVASKKNENVFKDNGKSCHFAAAIWTSNTVSIPPHSIQLPAHSKRKQQGATNIIKFSDYRDNFQL
jgi:hypothetical protein